MKNKAKELLKTSIFIIVFFILWIIRQYIYIHLDMQFTGYFKTLLSIALKFIFWIGFSFIYFRYVYKEKILDLLKFKENRKGILYAVALGVALLVLNMIYNIILTNSMLNFNLNFRGLLSVAIAAPLIEEVVFRGLILRKLGDNMNFFYANLITSILFVGIHFPGWLIWGDGISLEAAGSIFLVSLIWGYLYRKTESMWSPIVAHSLNNIVSMIV
ncbi:CPBP family intramembrane metalloprotease [Candidatus Dojkabacteria bacterium]|nr:CPBP family intramembrane metalloprotease [Candidatus Dojkabacteria bacterium]